MSDALSPDAVPHEDPWLSTAAAMRYADVSKATILRAVAAGSLASVKLNGKRDLRFRRSWIDAWLHGRVVCPE